MMRHLLHIGKCGGTVIRGSLKDHFGAIRKWTIKSNPPIHIHTHRVSLYDNDMTKTAFFIRNPITRYKSAFNDRLRHGGPLFNVVWKKAERRSFSTFKTANQLAECLSSNKKGVRHRARVACTTNIGHVNRRYKEWIGHPATFEIVCKEVLFIGLQEHLNDDFQKFCTKLKLGNVELITDPIKANVNSDVTEPLSNLAKQNIRKLLKEDFILYDLCCKERSRRIEG
jgi:ribosomal protein L32